MKQEKTKNRKRILYYVVLAVCVLLLVAATVLTVYFVTGGNNNNVLEKPPVTDENPPDDGKEEDPSQPSGGETVVRFIAPVDGEQTIEYGELYMNVSLGNLTYAHKARDYHAAVGTPVVCMADGIVIEASRHAYLGNLVAVDHGDGIVTYYYFIDPAVSVGDKVKQGDELGTISEPHGDEEHEGAHLHLEMKLNGNKVDPQDYIGLVYEEK